MLKPQPKRTTPRDPAYLAFVRTFNCLDCGWPAHLGGIEAHHIYTGGTSIKCSDYDTVPLCSVNARGCHRKADKSKAAGMKYRASAALLNRKWVEAGNEIKDQ